MGWIECRTIRRYIATHQPPGASGSEQIPAAEPWASAQRLMGLCVKPPVTTMSNLKSPGPVHPDDPLAFFITWTVYGTHLQGHERGWRKRRSGSQLAQVKLAEWHQERLNHEVLLLSPEQREVVHRECERHCRHRGWRLWEVNARTNHVHAVVAAPGYAGNVVRDQLKANCTRALREQWNAFAGRPVWTHGGDWECINESDDLEAVCLYVREGQD